MHHAEPRVRELIRELKLVARSEVANCTTIAEGAFAYCPTIAEPGFGYAQGR